MLKIKDSVDIKELEKYGFRFEYSSETGEIIKATKGTPGKKLTVFNNYRTFSFKKWGESQEFRLEDYVNCTHFYLDFNLLYDLIKADLVEKV